MLPITSGNKEEAPDSGVESDADESDADVLGFYSIVPSQRADARECIAIVFETDWTEERNLATITVGAALMRFLGSKIPQKQSSDDTTRYYSKRAQQAVSWLARDVLFIFLDKSKNRYGKAMRGFLKQYLDGELPIARRGEIRQAVVLNLEEAAATKIKSGTRKNEV